MDQAERPGTCNAAVRCLILIAALAGLASEGCNRHDGTAAEILEAHAAAFAECEQREAELTERIEQQKREIRALAGGQHAGDSRDSHQAIQALLEQLAKCRSTWEANVNAALMEAGVPASESSKVISEWLDTRHLEAPRPDPHQ